MGCFYVFMMVCLFVFAAINAEKRMSINLAKQRRKIADTRKQCSNKPNGLFATADSFSYVKCTDGIEEYHRCGKDKIFVPSCWQCLIQFPSQLGFMCEGRISESPLGKAIKYQHPWDCRAWIECIDESPKEYYCADGNIFDARRQRCSEDNQKCELAPVTTLQNHTPFIASEIPRRINAGFLWPNGNIVLMEGSSYSVFDEDDGGLLPGFPLAINDHKWSGIPSHIDAALSLPDQKTFFFKGKKFWLWGSPGYPKKISNEWLGIPDHLDSAFYWTHTNKVYFFKGEYFFRYNLEKRSVDAGYPREIRRSWPGATPSINAAVGLKNGTIFLFKGRKHFTFNPPFCRP